MLAGPGNTRLSNMQALSLCAAKIETATLDRPRPRHSTTNSVGRDALREAEMSSPCTNQSHPSKAVPSNFLATDKASHASSDPQSIRRNLLLRCVQDFQAVLIG